MNKTDIPPIDNNKNPPQENTGWVELLYKFTVLNSYEIVLASTGSDCHSARINPTLLRIERSVDYGVRQRRH
jgi:hypothetical protein